MMEEVIVGIPGPWADDYCEASDHYTTKIGGLPDWPVPDMDLRPDLLECGVCRSNLYLLAQVYAPISSNTVKVEERVIYIFTCPTPKCGSSPASWRAYRVQKHLNVEESNGSHNQPTSSSSLSLSTSKSDWREDLWTFDERGDDNDDDIDLEELSRALSKAGNLASHSKKPSSNIQTEADEKTLPISQKTRVIQDKKAVLPCFYIYSQKETYSKEVNSVCSKYSSHSIKEKNHNDVDEQAETWEQEAYEYDKALSADRTYLKFKKRMDAYPEQCFRYSYGGQPLLATSEVGHPGTCKLCGQSRHYEMQLMPPLFYFLLEATNDCFKPSVDDWNWMTIIIYTCSKSCSDLLDQEKSKNDGWIIAEEAVVVQYETSLNLHRIAMFGGLSKETTKYLEKSEK